jgi:hypothetical protein
MISLFIVAQPPVPTITNPVLDPIDGACDIGVRQIFTLDFGEAVYPVKGGTVSLNNQNGTEYIPIQFWWDTGTPEDNLEDDGTQLMGDGTTAEWSYVFDPDAHTLTIDFFGAGDYKLTQEVYYYVSISNNAIRNATGVIMPGIGNGGWTPDVVTGIPSGATCVSSPDNGWDVLVADLDAPAFVDLDPADEEFGVAVDAVLEIDFDELVQWHDGTGSGTVTNVQNETLGLWQPGDIALYYSTDEMRDMVGDQYGGDVIFVEPASVQIDGDIIYITWPDDMPPLSDVYVRIKPGLFTDRDCCGTPIDWAGFNGNGKDWQGTNTQWEWNFTTRDSEAPVVTYENYSGCEADRNFIVVIDELDLTTAEPNPALREDISELTTAELNNLVEITGLIGSYTVTLYEGTFAGYPDETVLLINPSDNLPSESTVTILLKPGMLWDSSYNPVNDGGTAWSTPTGDYDYPDITSVQSANWDGTSFDLVGNINEDATLYYIVVERTAVQGTGSTDLYPPTAEQVYDLAMDIDGADITAPDAAYDYWYSPTIQINATWAGGYFPVSGGDDFLHRILDLEETHGTEFRVFVIGIDNSECGPYNVAWSKDDGWVTPVPRGINSWILDILPPVPDFWADLIDPDDAAVPTGCTDYDSDGIRGIDRNGAIKITFNEGIRKANGDDIEPADLPDIFTITENTGSGPIEVGINTDISEYVPSELTVYLYPDSAFKSWPGYPSIQVTLIGNTIEDDDDNDHTYTDPGAGYGDGVEQNNSFSESFCVEDYCPPILSWKADRWWGFNGVTYDTVFQQSIVDCDPSIEVDPVTQVPKGQVVTNSVITIDPGEPLYIPADDEDTPGFMELLNNDPTSPNFVGRYVKIRTSDVDCDDARVGQIVYNGSSLADWDISIDQATGVITIEPIGFEYESETYYNIEVEAQLQNASRQTIADGVGAGCSAPVPVNNLSFITSDHVVPEVFFYEAAQYAIGPGSMTDPIPDCVDPLEVIDSTDRIGVVVTEWVEIGFDGFGHLEPSDTIYDANALRRYISLKNKNTGEAVPFDVEDFYLNGDWAFFYIDPYNYPEIGMEDVLNFVPGEQYEVGFISNPEEYDEDNVWYGNGALRDDHGNLIIPTFACFEVWQTPPPPEACLPQIYITPDVCKGKTSDIDNITIQFVFERAMQINPAVTDPRIAIWNAGGTAVSDNLGAIDVSSMDISIDGKTWTWNTAVTGFDYQHDLGDALTPGQYYDVRMTQEALIDIARLCPNPYPEDVSGLPYSTEIATTFLAGDGEKPTLDELDQDGQTILMTDNLTMEWSERVFGITGQVIEIFEQGTNSQVATVYGEDLVDGTDSIVILNSLFNVGLLEYNTCYYLHFNPGLVVDTCGNVADTSILNSTDWTFCIGDDPEPEIVDCAIGNPFYPPHDTTVNNTMPRLEINFTEPVLPVSGKYIEVYEQGSASSLYFQFDVDEMHGTNGNMTYYIETSEIFSWQGVNPDAFENGGCYDVNIDTTAFVAEFGVKDSTNKIISQATAYEPDSTICRWSFCIGDIIPPTVKFWPELTSPKQENIPTNAHLYAYISEPVNLGAISMTPENASDYFKLEVISNANDLAPGIDIPFVLEFIDNDKQKVRITPEDPLGPDVQNATMRADTWFRLTINNIPSDKMQDAAGNLILPDTTVFHTEDITCPGLTYYNAYDADSTSFWLDVDVDEVATVFYVVVRDGDPVPPIADVIAGSFVGYDVLASGSDVTDAGGSVQFYIDGLDGNEAEGYDFDVHVFAMDDEIDRFPIGVALATDWTEVPWPYTGPNPLDPLVDPSQPQWVYDIHPAPNFCQDSAKMTTITLCDDDRPFIVETYPVAGDTLVPIDTTFWIRLNEPIVLGMESPNSPTWPPHLSIRLRDHENNLAIPADFTVVVSGDTVFFYPIAETDVAFTLNDGGTRDILKEQHRYYVNIDRYAIYDEGNLCNSEVNYLLELLDKSWWFKTMDNTPPEVLCNTAEPSGDCVTDDENISITVWDGNAVSINTDLELDSPYVYIYIDDMINPHERIPLSYFEGPTVSGNDYTFTFPTSYHFLSDVCYTVRIPDGAFVDSYGNVSKDGCTWSFCTLDYEPPVASSGIFEDFSYLFNVYDDPEYYSEIHPNLPAGDEVTDLSTSSWFRVKFDEDVQIWDTSMATPSGQGWNPLINLNGGGGLTYADLSNILVVRNLTEGTELVWGVDYELIRVALPWERSYIFRVVIQDDDSHYGHGDDPFHPYTNGSMKSNTTYQIAIKANMVADIHKQACSAYDPNLMDEVDPLLTVTTRDDTPPQLKIVDAMGKVVCDTTCSGTTGYYNEGNPGNFWSQWPGSMSFDPCNVCVLEGPYIDLVFDKPIVKTPGDVEDFWPFGDGGVDWWTEANLGLDEDDFIDSWTSEYFRMARIDGSWQPVAPFDHVENIGDTIFRLWFSESLISEGTYIASFAPYMVKDQVRIPDGNEFLGLTCVFTVRDWQPPMVVDVAEQINDGTWAWHSVNPGQALFNPDPVDPMSVLERDTTSQLAIKFDEGVIPGQDKEAIIRSRNGQQRWIISSNDITPLVSGDYTTWVLPVDQNFREFTQYYVEIEPGFVQDTSESLCDAYPNNQYGIMLTNPSIDDGELVYNDTTYYNMDPERDNPFTAPNYAFEWNFMTGDMTPPTAIAYYPNHTIYAPKNSDLRIRFDENIFADCGGTPSESQGIFIYEDNGDQYPGEPGAFGNFVEFIPWNSPAIEIVGTDVYNGLVSDSVIIRPDLTYNEGEWKTNVRYYIRVSSMMWCDGADNFYTGVHDTTTWEFTITNDVEPVLASVEPLHDITLPVVCDDPNIHVEVDKARALVDLHMWFEDGQGNALDVAPGSGQVKIFEYIYNPTTFDYEEKLWWSADASELDFNGDQVTISDIPVRDEINMTNSCGLKGFYYVIVEPGTITNGIPGSLTFWEGVDNAFEWRFMTCLDDEFVAGWDVVSPLGDDWSIPGTDWYDPAKDGSVLVMDFSGAESIEEIPGTPGRVHIWDASDSSLVESIQVMQANISDMGHTLTLQATELEEQTAYFVTIDEGAFGDTSTCSTPFPGWDDAETWTFETGDYTAPVPEFVEPDYGDCTGGYLCDTLKWVFTDTEDGLLYQGVDVAYPDSGMVHISWLSEDETECTLEYSVPVKLDPEDPTGLTIMVDLCEHGVVLKDYSTYVITMDANTVTDRSPYAWSNIAYGVEAGWTYVTHDNTNPTIEDAMPAGIDEESMETIVIEVDEPVQPNNVAITVDFDGGPITFFADDMDFDGIAANPVLDTLFTFDLAGLPDETVFTVTVPEGAFTDWSCSGDGPNPNAEYTWQFTTDDNTPPIPDPIFPEANEVLGTYIDVLNDGISFGWDDIVTPVAGGAIQINDMVIPNDSDIVDFTNNIVTVTLGDRLAFNATHTVSVLADSYQDDAINPNMNELASWTFQIVDTTFDISCGIDYWPADGDSGIVSDPVLTIDFCEIVVPGCYAGAELHLYELLTTGGNSEIYSTEITADMISADGKTVSVPVDGLIDYTSYIVEIDEGAVCDEAGNPFKGISDPTEWNFTTGDNTPPEVISSTPVEGDDNLMYTADIEVDFSEPVLNVATSVMVDGATLDGVVMTNGDSTAVISISGGVQGATVTITMTDGITDKVNTAHQAPNELADAPVVLTFEFGDWTGPVLQDMTLVEEGETVSADNCDTTFVVLAQFDDEVIGVDGAVSVTGADLVSVVVDPVDPTVYHITVNGDDGADVTVEIDVTAITDNSVNANECTLAAGETGIRDYYIDIYAPTAISMTPQGVLDEDDTTFDLVLELSEDVFAGAGSLTVYDSTQAVVFATFDVSEVTISGSTVSVPVSLDKFTTYYVMVDPGFVVDVVGDEFAGITEDDVWKFTTQDFATPVIEPESIQFKVYPNPFSDYINIDNANKLARVVIADIAGRRVIDVMYPKQVIRTPNLVSGVYVVTLFDEDGIVKTERIVKR